MSTVLLVVFIAGILPMVILTGFARLLVASTDESTWLGMTLQSLDVRWAARRLDREYEALTR